MARRDGVVEACRVVSNGGGGEVHVRALGGLTQGQAGGHCRGQITFKCEHRVLDPVRSSEIQSVTSPEPDVGPDLRHSSSESLNLNPDF